MNAIEKYFEGERWQCAIGIGIGLLGIAAALYLLFKVNIPLYKGMAYPMLGISLLLTGICVGVFFRSPGDLQRVNGYVENRSPLLHTEEIPRMEKVMRTFHTIKLIELGLVLAGIALFVFLQNQPLWRGVGLGLAIEAFIMFGFDHVAERRGKEYWAFLQTVAKDR